MEESYPENIYEAFEEVAEKFPEKKAVVYLGRAFKYAEFRKLSEGLAASLYQWGVREGDKILIYIPNTPQALIIWLALQRLGAIPVPISPIYTSRDIKYFANDSGVETIFCMDTNLGYVIEVLPETPLKRVIYTNMVEFLPWWKKVIGRGFDKVPGGKIAKEKNFRSFKSMLKPEKISPSTLPRPEVKGDDMMVLVYTGGTLGEPKGVPLPHYGFIESMFYLRKERESVIPRGEDIMLQGGPLFHVLGMSQALGSLISGDTLILLPRVNLDGMLDSIQREKVKSIFAVPALYRMILEHERVDYYDLSSIEYCACAGDALPPEVANKWLKKFGKVLLQGYGATETITGISTTPPGIEGVPVGSSGKVWDIRKVRIVDPETMEPVAEGEPGEVLVSSNHMVKGYWNKPEETSEHFVEIDGMTWYKTGDIARIDKDGWLFFMDRTSDTIKHKGYRIAASEIESILQEHPAVIAACVVGIPDKKVGERIKAFVVSKDDARGVTSYDLMKWCREKTVSYKVPQYIEFRDMLPKSKVGKMLRREIRDDERRKLEKL